MSGVGARREGEEIQGKGKAAGGARVAAAQGEVEGERAGWRVGWAEVAEQAAWANWAGEGSSGRRGVNGPVWIGLAGRVRTLGGFGLV